MIFNLVGCHPSHLNYLGISFLITFTEDITSGKAFMCDVQPNLQLSAFQNLFHIIVYIFQYEVTVVVMHRNTLYIVLSYDISGMSVTYWKTK